MPKTTPLHIVSLALLSFLVTSAPSTAKNSPTPVQVRTIHRSIFPGDAAMVKLDLSLGDIEIEGTDGRNIEVEILIFCHRENLAVCTTRAQRIYVAPRSKRGNLNINLKRTPKNRAQGVSARMRVKVPRHLSLEVDVTGGNVEISGMEGSMEVDGLSSNVDIVHRRHQIGQVKLNVGVGKADLWLGEGRIEGRGFPRSVRWSGSGTSEIEVDLGTGDIAVRLE
jgi:hypothetical protein